MTYSGLLMLVLVSLAAYGVSYGWRKHPWVLGGIALLSVPISLSQTRNAMLGAVAGTAAILLLRRPRILLPLALAITGAFLLAPAAFRQRIESGWDANDPNTRNRIELVGTSLRLIRDNPLFGVGPKNVNTEALRYRGSREFPDWLYQHMHNNFLQLAAERGLPGLAFWLWLMGRFVYDAWGLFRRAVAMREREALLSSTASIGCWVALMISGLFEYNFGDSEVLILFLFLMSTPYAVQATIGTWLATNERLSAPHGSGQMS
jgi:O-antigen ligase